MHAKRILATVTCSGTCQAGAVVSVYVGHKNVFTDYSALDTLKQAGSATVSIPFSDKQLSLTKQLATLKAALADHQTITAFVRGAIVDPLGKAERETVAIKLTIRS